MACVVSTGECVEPGDETGLSHVDCPILGARDGHQIIVYWPTRI
jgi:hypothetical protein